ncbi:MAG: hypothetical protein QW543_05165 [Sulfolobales archaeon]
MSVAATTEAIKPSTPSKKAETATRVRTLACASVDFKYARDPLHLNEVLTLKLYSEFYWPYRGKSS